MTRFDFFFTKSNVTIAITKSTHLIILKLKNKKLHTKPSRCNERLLDEFHQKNIYQVSVYSTPLVFFVCPHVSLRIFEL
jgi:hypothetical protein